jgi:hypothetical protein
MKFKTGMLVGFGVGYVLGAKAGKERYEQIVEATRAFMENPGVQRLTDEVGKTVSLGKDRVSSVTNRKVEQFGDTLAGQASKAKEFVADKTPGSSSTAKASGSAKSSTPKTSNGEGKSASGASQTTSTRSSRGS